MHLLAHLGLLKTEMTDFPPTPSFTSICEIFALPYTGRLKKVLLSGVTYFLPIFVFTLSRFSGPDYLGAWNRLFRTEPSCMGHYGEYPRGSVSLVSHSRTWFVFAPKR